MDWSSCSVVISGSGAGAVPTLGCIFGIITNIIYWLLLLSGSGTIFMIVFAGIRFITSDGDQKKVEQARKTFIFAIIGIVLIFLSFFILTFIAYFTGVGCLNPNSYLSFTSCSN